MACRQASSFTSRLNSSTLSTTAQTRCIRLCHLSTIIWPTREMAAAGPRTDIPHLMGLNRANTKARGGGNTNKLIAKRRLRMPATHALSTGGPSTTARCTPPTPLSTHRTFPSKCKLQALCLIFLMIVTKVKMPMATSRSISGWKLRY